MAIYTVIWTVPTRLIRRVRYRCTACKHLEKSGDSALFNISEGIASYKARSKATKYDIARGEMREAQSAATALVLKGKLSDRDIAPLIDATDAVIGMLTIMIRNLEDRS
jgi:four helix bundle protein